MLSPEAKAILTEMYTAKSLEGADGPFEIDQVTRIDQVRGAELNRMVRALGARHSLEVGLAYGFSTIWIMDALPEGGSHTAMDPAQFSMWGGVGVTQARRLPKKRFALLEEMSIHALSDMIRARRKFDFIFIDGNHRFDDVLVDFYLCDQLLKVGGMMVLDDIWMPSIRTVLNFVTSNRAYTLLPQEGRLMAALRKDKHDDRDWRHFQPFRVETAPTNAARQAAG